MNKSVYDIQEIKEALWVIIKGGKIAQIISKDEPPLFINANNVHVKCSHCGNVTNMPKKREGLKNGKNNN